MDPQKYICLKITSFNVLPNITPLLQPWLYHAFVFEESPLFRQKTETYDLNNRFVKYYRILVREDAADPTSNVIEKILSEKLSSNIDFSIEIEGEGIVFRSDVWYNQLCIAGIAQW